MSKKSQNRILLSIYYLFLVVGLLYVYFVKKDNSFLLINNHHNAFLDVSMRWMTWLGDGLFVVILCVLLGLYKLRWFFLSIIPYLISGLIAQVLKRFVFNDVMRPLKYFSEKSIEIYTVSGIDVHLSHSFPSGHTTSAFALFFMFALLSGKLRYKLLFLISAIMVGYSRIYLAQHFPIDVLAGSLIGVISVLISFPYIMSWKKSWLDFSFVSFITKSNAD